MVAPFDCSFIPDELATVQQQISLSLFDIFDQEQHMDKVGYGVYPLRTRFTYNIHVDRTQGLFISRTSKNWSCLWRIYDFDLAREYDCTCSRYQGDYVCLDTLLHQGQVGGSGYLRLDQASTALEVDIKLWSILDTIHHHHHYQSTTTTTPAPASLSLDPSEFTHFVNRSMTTHLGRDNKE
ncbi:hypothetical protein BCR42DRAFT_437579 [Absidia repens]|uniref:Uncharacterized protein n=1 Tax=Absidia repens TaxID=90262 RepID=A0A1X2IGQ6_9FUNG|nr:hypothetical protein BCR42DRAFT_437579 [Absidia repens]